MRVRDLMSSHPMTAADAATDEEVERLLETGSVHHLPLMDGNRLVGLWVATSAGLRLFGPEAVVEVQADEDAADAVEALLDEHEAILVRDGDEPVGVLTRTNVVNVLRLALGQGLGRRFPHPTVLRLVGPAEAGKTTLILRTLARLPHCEAAVVMTDEAPYAGPPDEDLGGVRILHAPEARWRRGLYGCIQELSAAQVVLIEDTADLPTLGANAMDDLLVLVIPAGREGEVSGERLIEASAVVLTRLDDAPAGFDLDVARDRLRGVNPRLPVFFTAAARDARGLEAWADWIEHQVLRRQH